MATRSNAMSELVRFWLEWRHGCFLREAVPVPVYRNQSDIDFMAIRPDGQQLRLPTGADIGPRLIVETKDEHDWEPSGRDFSSALLSDIGKMASGLWIPKRAKGVKFTMLRQEHHEVASETFSRGEDFDRLFVFHAVDRDLLGDHIGWLQERRIHLLTVQEVLRDLQAWYKEQKRPGHIRNALTGDLFHLLFGFCGVTVRPDH